MSVDNVCVCISVLFYAKKTTRLQFLGVEVQEKNQSCILVSVLFYAKKTTRLQFLGVEVQEKN